MEVEKLDLDNVLELQRIRDILLQYDPKLLSFFEEIIGVANKKLNDEPEKKNSATQTKDTESEEEDIVLESDSDDEVSPLGCYAPEGS